MRLYQYINESANSQIRAVHINNIIKRSGEFIKRIMPAIKSSNNPMTFLFSGRKDVNESVVQIKKVRKRRKPRDTSNDVSQYFDNAFKDKFGWRGRTNTVFCTGEYDDAEGYGKVYMIFPIGKYKFIYSPKIKDLYKYQFIVSARNIPPRIVTISDIKHLSLDGVYNDFDIENLTITTYIDNPIDFDTKKPIQITSDEETEKYIEKETEKNTKAFLKNILLGIDEAINTYTDKNIIKAIESTNEIMLNCERYYAVYAGYNKGNLKILYNYFKKYGTSEATKEKLDDIKRSLGISK